VRTNIQFFRGAFASVGTLKYAGVTEPIARGMISLAQGNSTALLMIFQIQLMPISIFFSIDTRHKTDLNSKL